MGARALLISPLVTRSRYPPWAMQIWPAPRRARTRWRRHVAHKRVGVATAVRKPKIGIETYCAKRVNFIGFTEIPKSRLRSLHTLRSPVGFYISRAITMVISASRVELIVPIISNYFFTISAVSIPTFYFLPSALNFSTARKYAKTH